MCEKEKQRSAWLGIRRMTYWWLFYICYALCILTVLLYLYCIHPNDSDSQSSLAHVLFVRIMSDMVRGSESWPIGGYFYIVMHYNIICMHILFWTFFYIYILYPSWFRIPSHLCRIFSLLHVSGMVGDAKHVLLVAVLHLLCIIYFDCFFISIYCIRRHDSDSQSSLAHVLVIRMCPAWLGVRIMTYWRMFVYICMHILFWTCFYIYILYPSWFRIPSHLCRIFSLLHVSGMVGDPKHVLLVAVLHLLCIIYFDCFFISIYCTRPNDSDSQSSLSHVSLCSHVSGMAGDPKNDLLVDVLYLLCIMYFDCAFISLLYPS